MSRFRLATLNVHSFYNPVTYSNNINKLVSILKPLNLDLIAVQEIRKNTDWSRFHESLGLPYSAYTDVEGAYLGNGIASTHPIKTYSVEKSSACFKSSRYLLRCQLDGAHPFVENRTFAVTHLDHTSENLRIEELNRFHVVENNVDILMGDMNALTRSDYTDDYYTRKIVEVRKENYWETPCFHLTSLITNDWSYDDAFRLKNPDLKDDSVTTCRFGTRIDYIYLRPRVDDSWMLSECSIIDTNNETDHNAVLAEFTKKPNM